MFSIFANPWMLLALLAVSLPWIIEWLFRRRRRQVDLPTIRFLLRTKEQENIRRQDRILLLLRMLGILLLVMALTRPQLRKGLVGGSRTRQIVFLLDGTGSMHQQTGVTTAFGLSQKRAAAIVRGVEGAATVTTVYLGTRAEPVMEEEADLHTAASRIESLRAGLGAAPISVGLQWISDYLDRTGRQDVEFYVFSDFQKQTWVPPGGQTAETSKLLRKMGSHGEVYLIDVGSEPTYNYIVTDLRPTEWALSTGMPVSFRAAIETRGEPPGESTTLTFLVDGVKKDVREVTPGTSPVAAEFAHSFAMPGEYLVEVVIEGDQHMVDNRRTYLCYVPDHFRVLILDESIPPAGAIGPAGAPPPSGPLDKESIFLERAIQPPSHPGMDKVSRFTAKTIHPSALSFENLDDYRVIVLAPTSTLTEQFAARLENYANAGGSLWVFVGPEINAYDYNKFLYKENAGPLPCQIGGRTKAEEKKQPHLEFGQSPHAALHELSGSTGNDARFLGSYEMGLPEGAKVVMTLSDRKPAVIEKEFGRGRVLLFNTTAGVRWTHLPATLEFPILVQGMLKYLVGNPDRDVNLLTGDRFSQRVFVSSQHLLLRLPNGQKERLAPLRKPGQKDAWQVAFDETDQQGVYEIVDVAEGVVPRTRFVVNHRADEGDLASLSSSDVRSAFGRTGYEWVRPEVPIDDLVAKLHSVTEMAPAFLWLLVIVFGAEAYLAGRFGRRRGKAAQ